jgi:hypothetical protein
MRRGDARDDLDDIRRTSGSPPVRRTRFTPPAVSVTERFLRLTTDSRFAWMPSQADNTRSEDCSILTEMAVVMGRPKRSVRVIAYSFIGAVIPARAGSHRLIHQSWRAGRSCCTKGDGLRRGLIKVERDC